MTFSAATLVRSPYSFPTVETRNGILSDMTLVNSSAACSILLSCRMTVSLPPIETTIDFTLIHLLTVNSAVEASESTFPKKPRFRASIRAAGATLGSLISRIPVQVTSMIERTLLSTCCAKDCSFDHDDDLRASSDLERSPRDFAILSMAISYFGDKALDVTPSERATQLVDR
jgi:hypothetical protein